MEWNNQWINLLLWSLLINDSKKKKINKKIVLQVRVKGANPPYEQHFLHPYDQTVTHTDDTTIYFLYIQFYWSRGCCCVLFSRVNRELMSSHRKCKKKGRASTQLPFGKTAQWGRTRPSPPACGTRLSPAGTGDPCSWGARRRPTILPRPGRSEPPSSGTCRAQRDSPQSLRTPDRKSLLWHTAGSCTDRRWTGEGCRQ